MEEEYVSKLEELLTVSIKHSIGRFDRIALSYSGGLDCSVIASICSRFTEVQLYVTGTNSSQDIKAASAGSEILDLPLEKVIIGLSDVENALPHLIEILKTRNALEISIELSLYFVAKNTKEDHIMVGQGADELFGGYSRYMRMDGRERENRMRSDVTDYLNHNLKQEMRIAGTFDKTLITPYISPPLIDYIQALPMEVKIRKNERKYILKALAREIGLSSEIVDKPKKAVQYGSGILNLLKELAKREDLEVHEYLKRI